MSLNLWRKITELERELTNLRQSFQMVVYQYGEELSHLHTQVNELSQRVAHMPTPLRSTWSRTSAPAWQRETLALPTPRTTPARLSSTKLKPVPPVIERITLEMVQTLTGPDQIVVSYDKENHPVPGYCGSFKEVGLKVLDAAGNKHWDFIGSKEGSKQAVS